MSGSEYFKKWDDAPTMSISGKELGEYKDIKKLRQKAKEYYQQTLQGQIVENKTLGKINFYLSGFKESIQHSADTDILKSFVVLKEIVKRGKVGEFEKPHKARKDEIVGFYPIYCNVNISGNKRKIEVLIGKNKQGKLFYDMSIDYNRAKTQQCTKDSDEIYNFNLFLK
jgi:hypothetical protein